MTAQDGRGSDSSRGIEPEEASICSEGEGLMRRSKVSERYLISSGSDERGAWVKAVMLKGDLSYWK